MTNSPKGRKTEEAHLLHIPIPILVILSGHTDIGHSFRSPYEDNLEWGILGSDAFVDLGCTTGFCSDRFRGIRLGRYNYFCFKMQSMRPWLKAKVMSDKTK